MKPDPNVVLRGPVGKGSAGKGRRLEVFEAQTFYAVLYDGKPIGLRNIAVDDRSISPPRYPRPTFTAPGYARALARRLNEMFETKKFTVAKLVIGDTLG